MSKRTFIGKIVSDKMQKTVVVAVDVPKKHNMYSKKIKTTKRLLSKNDIGAKLGDWVTLEETRPISKHCSYKIISMVTKEDK